MSKSLRIGKSGGLRVKRGAKNVRRNHRFLNSVTFPLTGGSLFDPLFTNLIQLYGIGGYQLTDGGSNVGGAKTLMEQKLWPANGFPTQFPAGVARIKFNPFFEIDPIVSASYVGRHYRFTYESTIDAVATVAGGPVTNLVQIDARTFEWTIGPITGPQQIEFADLNGIKTITAMKVEEITAPLGVPVNSGFFQDQFIATV